MPAKRSRLIRSSSAGEIRVSEPLPKSSNSPIVNERNPEIAESAPATKSILTLSSPTQDVRDSAQLEFRGFSDSCFCFSCKKRILLEDTVYMYRVRAFCTPECRDEQIKLDEKEEASGT